MQGAHCKPTGVWQLTRSCCSTQQWVQGSGEWHRTLLSCCSSRQTKKREQALPPHGRRRSAGVCKTPDRMQISRAAGVCNTDRALSRPQDSMQQDHHCRTGHGGQQCSESATLPHSACRVDGWSPVMHQKTQESKSALVTERIAQCARGQQLPTTLLALQGRCPTPWEQQPCMTPQYDAAGCGLCVAGEGCYMPA